MNKPIKSKERETIIQSLRSGVVPKIGLQHIQVGRNNELKSFIKDIDIISDGGSSFRFVIGEYGSGKTFFLSLVRSIALEKGLVTIHADLSPTKRFQGTDGKARMLLADMINNLSTRTKQDGNALQNILEKFITIAKEEAKLKNSSVSTIITHKLSELNEYTGGYNFITVIKKFYEAVESGNDDLKNCAINWLKAGYTTKTETYKDLGIKDFINDASFFNTLILYSVLVKKAGYKGLLICMDEMVNLYRITNTVSRKANYEVILTMLNNTLQGSLSNIGFIMCGTPEFMTDTNRGLYSYEALRSRLAENNFSKKLGVVDFNSVVLRLANLTKEEVYILLCNLRHVFAGGNEEKYLVPDNALIAFLNYCSKKIGDSYFRTPRTTIKGFLDLLSILEQYPEHKWSDVIDIVEVNKDVESSLLNLDNTEGYNSVQTDDEFANFKI